jgi:hypothetical protein
MRRGDAVGERTEQSGDEQQLGHIGKLRRLGKETLNYSAAVSVGCASAASSSAAFASTSFTM